MLRIASILALLSLAACSTKSASGADDAGADGGVLAARPYTLVVPDSYDASKPTPFVLLLHGYGATGQLEDMYMGLTITAKAHGFLYAYADGTLDKSGKHFWNATDACCNLDQLAVDDVGYIDALIADVASKYNVDAKRVYLVGHSNGAFMAHRYACERAPKIAGIVSLAGATYEDPAACAASEPVSVLQVHGDQDDTIPYDGGVTTDSDGSKHPFPSARDTVARWAAKDGCTQPIAATGTTLDLDLSIPGNETVEESYGVCPANTTVRLWTIHGAGHVPGFGASWGDSIWGFLDAQSKP